MAANEIGELWSIVPTPHPPLMVMNRLFGTDWGKLVPGGPAGLSSFRCVLPHMETHTNIPMDTHSSTALSRPADGDRSKYTRSDMRMYTLVHI